MLHSTPIRRAISASHNSNTASNRGRYLRWLRNTHGMLGLWGAVLGLLFGATGILLNHRNVMKLPYAQYEKSSMELVLAQDWNQGRVASVETLAGWLQLQLKLNKPAFKTALEPARQVIWNGQPFTQPALWKVDFHTPQYSINAEYSVGNRFVSLKRQDANLFALLTRMHKGVGMSTGWILLADSLAGAIMLLSITGTLLWTKMRRSRLALVAVAGGSLVLAVIFTVQAI